MKLKLFLLALLLAPVLAQAQPAPGVPPPVPTRIPPIATPTVDLRHAPKIASLHPKFDFHNVDEGPDIIHKFTIRNKGRAPLKITNVGTSCGCTAAVIQKQGTKDESATLPVEIPPGGFGTIKATYHTSGRPGHATKIITVTSNDPANPAFQLQLDMTVVRDVDVQPDRVYLYNVKFKQARDTSIKILGKPGLRLSILSAESSNKVVTVTSLAPVTENAPAPVPTPGQVAVKDQKRYGATLMVTLPATQPIGMISDDVVVKTDNKKKPEVHIQVMGEVVGRVQYNPKNINFSPHQDMPVSIQLTADPASGFVVREVRSLKHIVRPAIKKSIGPTGTDQYTLVASVVKNLPKDSDGKDQIVLTTNDTDQKSVTIDVTASK